MLHTTYTHGEKTRRIAGTVARHNPVVNQGEGERRMAGILTVPFVGDNAIVCLLFGPCMEVQGCVDGHGVCDGVTGSARYG
jgi:hypothetical protein